jgi:hypothetical protein
MLRARSDQRPKPRARVLTLDRGFLVGMGLVVALAWWVHGDEPPGLPGEPDLGPYRGAPLLVVYGAPGCMACETQWRALAPTLPAGLQVLHLAAREAVDDARPATAETARRWASTLQVADAAVLPAALPNRALPSLVLRSARGRWRFEQVGALDAKSRERLQQALAFEGLPASAASAP